MGLKRRTSDPTSLILVVESELLVGSLEVVMSEEIYLWVAMLARIRLVLVKAKNADRERRLGIFILSTDSFT